MAPELGPGATFAGYRIDEILGRGGMGLVYLAKDRRLGRQVALKVLPAELAQDPTFRQRFTREARIAASLDHPHIVPVYEAGEADGLLFLAMRLVRGTDLGSLLRLEGQLSPQRALSIVTQVASALDAAHSAGLVHRDVKPSNVLVTSGATPLAPDHCYLADFGVTRRLGSTGLTASGVFVGTLEYAAPEQIRGERVDGRADVYALGCLLYECLSGRSPFEKESDVALIYAHLEEPPPRLTDARPGVPSALNDVITRAMAKARDKRYASCLALAEDARRVLETGALRARSNLPDTKLKPRALTETRPKPRDASGGISPRGKRRPGTFVAHGQAPTPRKQPAPPVDFPAGFPTGRGRRPKLAIILGLVLVAGVAGGAVVATHRRPNSAPRPGESGFPQGAGGNAKGGTLVAGAEQEPDCADWIDQCSGSSWGVWMMEAQTMPRAFDVVKQGGAWVYKPSILITGAPDLKTSPTQVVTYHINPKAVWSDGLPITSGDFKYTWDQIAHGQNIYDQTGYQDIASVDTPDTKTAVVTYSKNYAGWRGLFGGQYGIFPSHILQGKDRDALMKDGYTWSGGPWTIQSWQRQTSITLVPNTRYWGTKSHLDKVIFKFSEDTATEFQAFKTGETMAIYPQPQPDAVQQIAGGLTGARSKYTADTGNLEALWFNNSKFPFNSKSVREAVGYALDRDAIVSRLFSALGVKQPMQTLDPPILAPFTDTSSFSEYKPDTTKVDSLMKGDGWTKGADGIWAKGGQKASIELKTTAGNKRRQLTAEIVQSQLKTGGFNVTINPQKSGDLFGKQLPAGDFEVALYAQVATTLDPADCSILCSSNIPTAANNNTGQNWQRVNIPALDAPLQTVDHNLDDSVRKDAGKSAAKILADNAVALPLDPLPNILLWNTKVVGPIDDNPLFSMFVNLNEWGLKQ